MGNRKWEWRDILPAADTSADVEDTDKIGMVEAGAGSDAGLIVSDGNRVDRDFSVEDIIIIPARR